MSYFPNIFFFWFCDIFLLENKQIATALFANSPFSDGKPNGYLSLRRFLNVIALLYLIWNLFPLGFLVMSLFLSSQIWTDTDNNRAGMLPFVFYDTFGWVVNLLFERKITFKLSILDWGWMGDERIQKSIYRICIFELFFIWTLMYRNLCWHRLWAQMITICVPLDLRTCIV